MSVIDADGKTVTVNDSSRIVSNRIARSALETVDALDLEARIYPTPSGGECQRLHLARILAQIWESQKTDSDIYCSMNQRQI